MKKRVLKQAKIQEELFAEWDRVGLIVDNIDNKDAINTVYNAYQGAMARLTKIQKKRVSEEERQFRISLIVALVARKVTITAPIYIRIINHCKLGKNFSEEAVANIVVNEVLNDTKKDLKYDKAKRRIKLL